MTNFLLNSIIRQLKEIQDGGSWLDESFRKKIEDLTGEDAFRRPIPEIHSVAEIISHCLVWRKECMMRLKGVKTDLMTSPNNWKDNDQLKTVGWTNLKDSFYSSQFEFIQILENLDDNSLHEQYLDTPHNLLHLLEGIIQHDIYHLGQVGVTIKLL